MSDAPKAATEGPSSMVAPEAAGPRPFSGKMLRRRLRDTATPGAAAVAGIARSNSGTAED